MELWLIWASVADYLAISVAFFLYAIRRRRRGGPSAQATLCAIAGTLFALVFLFCLLEGPAERAAQRQDSPGGSYMACVMVGGWLVYPSDTTVIVRRRGDLFWHTVYVGAGWMAGDGEGSPEFEWRDDTHLVLHIHGPDSGLRHCRPVASPVVLVCKASDW